MDSEPKVKKQLQYNYVDIISELPDSVLCKILSFLPIKYVVSTSIVSKRWNSLFPFSYPLIRLDLDDSSIVSHNAFVGFMDNLFNSTLVNVPCVEILKLNFTNDFGDEKIISWVCAALRLKVRELLLCFWLGQWEPLFGSLNGCTTLTRLELGSGFSYLVLDYFTLTLPNLRVLRLSLLDFSYEDRDVFSKLISGCPKLEDLCLYACFFDRCDGPLCIRSSVLKKFTVELCSTNIKLELDAPNLEVLNYGYDFPGMSSICNFKSLRAASFSPNLMFQVQDDVASFTDERDVPVLAALVSACSSTVDLYLSGYSMTTLQCSTMQLPEFQNLTSLAIGCVVNAKGWMTLARFLLLTPNLVKLVFEGMYSFVEQGEAYSWFEAILLNPPVCLELHLREIEFKEFQESDDELKLVEYFLRNGKVIHKLKLHCLPFKEIETSKLLMLPKHSKIDFLPRKNANV